MTRLRSLALAGLLLATTAHRADASWSGYVATAADSGVHIVASSPVDHPPLDGFMPCWVAITNGSGAAHTWDITLTSGKMYGSNGNRSTAAQSVRVENGATVRVPVLLPLSAGDGYYRQNRIDVDGYGVVNSTAGMPSIGYSGGANTAFIAMGESLATPLWEMLKKEFKDKSIELLGSPLDPASLGNDWRGLIGFDSIWLTGAEYARLDPARRLAIRHWVDRGGGLFLFTPSLDPALRTELAILPEADASSPGYGRVQLVPRDPKTMDVAQAMPLVDSVRRVPHQLAAVEATDWRMTKAAGTIPINAKFLIAFIFLFAVVAGPVNLFWLANSTRRHRLFWTTPLISVGASVLLIAIILFQDGFGGRGQRVMVTRLFPAQRKALVVQEQVARTGVLLSRRFSVSEDVVLSALKVSKSDGKKFEQAGRNYSGDWFASRSVQAHRLEAIASSRAEIQLVNPEAAAGGAPPEIVSSIPATLKDICYVDAKNQTWRGAGLRTGGRVTLHRGDRLTPTTDGSGYLTELLAQAGAQTGAFCAVADDDAPYLATLGAIRWTKQLAVYLGPVTR